jgi:hypothetical protein
MLEWMLTKMDSLQVEMKTNQAKTDANQEVGAEMKTNQAEMLAQMYVCIRGGP